MTKMLTASIVLLWLVVIVLSILVVVLYRQFGLIYIGSRERIEETGLRVGSQAPDGIALNVEGRDGSWRWRLDGGLKATFALMTAPDCSLCADLMPRLNGVAEKWRGVVRLVAIDSSNLQEANWTRQLPPDRAWIHAVDTSGRMHHRLDVQATPFAFVVDANGMVADKGLVNFPSSIDAMISAFVGKRDGDGVSEGVAQRD